MGALNRSAVALTLVTVAGASGPAFGQSSVTVAPSVAAGPVYDTNVFFTPTPEADLIWRLTCGLATEKMGPRSNFAAQYSFDAEQFRDHPSLSTPLAHQIGEARTQWRPSSAVTAAINGGYERTLHPADLNLTTGLAIGRLQAWRGSGGTDLKIRGGAHTEVGLGYQFTRDVVEAGGDVNTHAGRVEVTQETGVHDALHLKYLPQAFLFGAGGTVQQPDLVWHVVAVGWTHDVSKTTHLSVEAGPRIRPGQVEPYVLLSLEGKGRAAERSVVYTRTSTTAIGVIGPIEVQSILGSAGYNRPGAIDLRLAGGVYRNVINRDAILVYRIGGAITGHIGGPVSVAATFGYDRQQRRLPAATPPVALGIFALDTGGPVERGVIALHLVVAPAYRPRSGTPALPASGGRDDSGSQAPRKNWRNP